MDRRTLLFSAGAAALVGGGGAAAQASEPIATLRNVRIAGQAGEAVDLHLRDGRIAQIGRSLPASDGQDLDLSGKFVSPGLISAHCHIGSVQGVSVGAQFYTRENIARQLGVYAAYGVTTVASLGLNTDLFYAIQRDVRTGAIQGADLFGADRGFGVPNGGPPAQATSAQLFRPATEAEARANVRESIERGADFIKLWLDDFQGAHLVKMDPSIYRAIIDEAHRGGRKVIAHVYYLEDARAVLEAGADILGHGVRDRPVDQAFIDLMKRRKAACIPTLGLDEAFYLFAEQPELLQTPALSGALDPALRAQLSNLQWRAGTLSNPALPQWKAAFATNKANAAALHRAGVTLAFGADSGPMPLRIPGFAEHRELALLVEAGLSPREAMTIATEGTASVMGLADRGRIQTGMLADLIILPADPFADVRTIDRIEAVYRLGRRVVAGPRAS